MTIDLDLNVDSPDKVSPVLQAAAQAYYEANIELESAWQDKNAGKAWSQIARILEQAATKIDKLNLY